MTNERQNSTSASPSTGEAFVVGNNFHTWWFLALAALTVSGLVRGALWCLAGRWEGPIMLVVGIAAGLGVMLATGWIVFHQAIIQVTPTGFIYADRHRRREIFDEQVICAALHSQSNYSLAVLNLTLVTLELWVKQEAGPERFLLVKLVQANTLGPLQALAERVQAHLLSRAEELLATGRSFDGEGWTIDTGVLAVGDRDRTREIPIVSLTAVDTVDEQLWIWQSELETPVAKIPMRTANAHVLLALLQSRIPHSAPLPTDNASNLGRVLFERRACIRWVIPLLIVVSLVVALNVPKMFLTSILTVCLVLDGILLLVWIRGSFENTSLIRFEHAVRVRWLWRAKTLWYADLNEFTFQIQPQFIHGIYTGTKHTLLFLANRGNQPHLLRYVRTSRLVDEELVRLCDVTAQ
ncbi:MAG: hypothetical protein ACKV0T_08285 [Planctomycetales bacterium]